MLVSNELFTLVILLSELYPALSSLLTDPDLPIPLPCIRFDMHLIGTIDFLKFCTPSSISSGFTEGPVGDYLVDGLVVFG